MKCPLCKARTPGFPDRCASCGGPILSPWHDYYRWLLYPGIVLVLNSPWLIEGAIENDDALRFIIGILNLILGVYLVSISAILWHRRSRKTKE